MKQIILAVVAISVLASAAYAGCGFVKRCDDSGRCRTIYVCE